MNASEKFLAVLDSARAYIKLHEIELTSKNLNDEMNDRHDARERLKNAVEDWDA